MTAAAAPSPSPRDSGWVAFRSRDFTLFFAARFLSATALLMQTVAVGWLVYDLTDSALALGITGLVAFLPVIGLTLIAGHVADRYDRRLVLIGCYIGATLAGLGLVVCAVSETPSVVPIYALVLVFGVTRAFAMPAGQALLPSLVPTEHYPNAVTLTSSAWQAATVLGPALGGLLFVFGSAVVFAVAALGFFAALLLLALLRVRQPPRVPAKMTWTTLFAGVRFIRSRPVIFGAISLDLFAVLLGGATALLPIFARDILHVGPTGLGLLRTMPAVGAVAMALFLAHRPLQRRAGKVMFVAVGVFGLATIGFGLSESMPLSLACLFVLGAADMISVVIRQTLVQIDTPDEMRGRVASVNVLFIGASNELGEFESGVVAALFGAVASVLIGGVGSILIAGLWVRLFPELWHRDRLVSTLTLSDDDPAKR